MNVNELCIWKTATKEQRDEVRETNRIVRPHPKEAYCIGCAGFGTLNHRLHQVSEFCGYYSSLEDYEEKPK